ncbi:MAG: DUF1376 domain-containing protein [Erythrobacter sp.]
MAGELFFRFYPSRFMAGIRGLNAVEVKVYISLLCRIYEHNGPIENDPLVLATYCEVRRAAFDKALAKLLALGKLYETDDGLLSNRTCDDEISQRASKSEFARRAGVRSAQKRQKKQTPEATDVERPFNQREMEMEMDNNPPPPPRGERSSGSSKKAEKGERPIDLLCEILPEDTAKAWLDHRAKIRKPMTPHAAKLMVGALRKLADPVGSVNQSIINGWTGVFEIKATGAQPGAETFRKRSYGI